jgi:aldehyde dehydrogenase (NAD+)
MMDKARHYIDGSWREGERWQDVVNPATGEPCAVTAMATSRDVEDAIAAARRAFDTGPWPRMSRFERSDLLARFRDILRGRRDEVVEAAVTETGAPVTTAGRYHFDIPMEHLDFFIEGARRDPRTPLPISFHPGAGGTTTLGASVMVREPVGVVGSISAYNQPFYINMQKVAPALAMGNTLVLKPSPQTPIASSIMAEALDEAGFPPGVFNLVIGDAEVGVPLSSDPRIDMVTFTGSDAIGIAVAQQAASTLKRVQLELGGKSAMIIRADGDLDIALAQAVGVVSTQAGQGCTSVTRHLVHADVAEEFVGRLSTAYESLVVGDPTDPGTNVGPLISAAQRDRVEGYISRAVADGSQLVTGGSRPAGLDRGFYVQPTVFAGVDNASELAQREVFGPVVAVVPFRTDDEAVTIANDSWYGLGGAIVSADVGRAYEMAEQLRTGQVLINGGNGGTPATDPFGGYKRSGLGRERGELGLDDYTQVKTIKFHGA